MRYVKYVWDGDYMVPYNQGMLNLVRSYYRVGQEVTLGELDERSDASHGHYFARLTEIHATLHEHYDELWPTVEEMRGWALCRTDYCIEKRVVCDTVEEARRWSAFVRATKTYTEASVVDTVVVIRQPLSQSYKSMGKTKFEASKKAVLELLEPLLDGDVTAIDEHMKGSHAAQNAV